MYKKIMTNRLHTDIEKNTIPETYKTSALRWKRFLSFIIRILVPLLLSYFVWTLALPYYKNSETIRKLSIQRMALLNTIRDLLTEIHKKK